MEAVSAEDSLPAANKSRFLFLIESSVVKSVCESKVLPSFFLVPFLLMSCYSSDKIMIEESLFYETYISTK